MYNPEILSALEKARELLSDRSRWTQGNLARNVFGDSVAIRSPKATCWCSIGAVFFNNNVDRATFALDVLRETNDIPYGKIGQWNDSHTHSEVLQGFDNAIAYIRKELSENV